MKIKSVQSINPFKSVIQTSYDIVKRMVGPPDPDSYRDRDYRDESGNKGWRRK